MTKVIGALAFAVIACTSSHAVCAYATDEVPIRTVMVSQQAMKRQDIVEARCLMQPCSAVVSHGLCVDCDSAGQNDDFVSEISV